MAKWRLMRMREPAFEWTEGKQTLVAWLPGCLGARLPEYHGNEQVKEESAWRAATKALL